MNRPPSDHVPLGMQQQSSSANLCAWCVKHRLLSQLESTIELDGRALVITPAVDRQEATKISSARPDIKDKRNLYLMAEGCMLLPNDPCT
jgi:hypothetical protein